MESNRRLLACAALLFACGGTVDGGHPCASTASASVTLAAAADARGIHIGNFFYAATSDAGFQNAVDEFDLYTLPVFFDFVEPTEDQFDFTLPDAVADAAPPTTVFYVPGFANGAPNVHNPSLPDWLTFGNFDGATLRAILTSYVDTVVRHFEAKYPGRVIAYEAALEPLSWQGSSGIWNRIGLDAGEDAREYVRVAFATARAAAPAAKLYVDDWGAETSGTKSDQLFQLVTSLKNDGVSIDGVGFEGHFSVEDGGPFAKPPAADDMTLNMERFGAEGFELMITSADIAIRDDDVSQATLDEQAQGFRALVHACLSVSACKAFSTWGVGDKDSWIPQAFSGWGSPLLFDATYAPKPAYDAVKTELLTCPSP